MGMVRPGQAALDAGARSGDSAAAASRSCQRRFNFMSSTSLPRYSFVEVFRVSRVRPADSQKSLGAPRINTAAAAIVAPHEPVTADCIGERLAAGRRRANPTRCAILQTHPKRGTVATTCRRDRRPTAITSAKQRRRARARTPGVGRVAASRGTPWTTPAASNLIRHVLGGWKPKPLRSARGGCRSGESAPSFSPQRAHVRSSTQGVHEVGDGFPQRAQGRPARGWSAPTLDSLRGVRNGLAGLRGGDPTEGWWWRGRFTCSPGRPAARGPPRWLRGIRGPHRCSDPRARGRGKVLASSIIREIAAGSGIRFDDHEIPQAKWNR